MAWDRLYTGVDSALMPPISSKGGVSCPVDIVGLILC